MIKKLAQCYAEFCTLFRFELNENENLSIMRCGRIFWIFFEKESFGGQMIRTHKLLIIEDNHELREVLKTKYPDVPIIAMTGFGEEPLSLASETKADRVLRKPFDLAELEYLITDLIPHKNTETAKKAL